MARISQYIPVLLLGFFMIPEKSHQQGIDELIAAASVEPQGFDLIHDLSGNNILWDLDMMLTKEQYQALQLLDSSDDPDSKVMSRSKRKAIKALNYRWKDKTIPYKLARGVFSSNNRNQIQMAIDEWNKYTCLTLREATSRDSNRIYLDNGGGCYSYVGMTGGSQKVGLAPGCRVKGVIVHEIGHAVGFHHEQNRPDRDDHVRIMRSNIPTNLYYNFQKYPWSKVTTHNVPYDYGSVMHYGATAFSTNGQYTIRTVNPSDQHKIGNRKGLSFFDIKLANIMYKCDEGCKEKPTCPGHGFVGKDCQCWCPGSPVRKCDGTDGGVTSRPGTTPTPGTTPKPRCQDQNKHCGAWAQGGYCGRNSYVKTYCRESCGRCSGGGGTGVGACKDLREHCEAWKARGYCTGRFEVFMSENCAKTCKKCRPNTNPGGDGTEEGQIGSKDGAMSTLNGSGLAAMLTLAVSVAFSLTAGSGKALS